MPHQFANVLKLRILGNFKKILEVPGIKGWCPIKTLTVVSQNRKKKQKKNKQKTQI